VTLFDVDDLPERSETLPVAESALRVCLTIAYDGSAFHGFAINPGVDTIGGTLRDALQKLLGHQVELTVAGRTDTGVHAWGQVVTFDAPAEHADPVGLQRSLNRLLAPQIVTREAKLVPPDFDARRSARSRTYRYTVLNRPVPDPFLAHVAWHVAQPLELGLLKLACDPLIGEHDFSAFCRRPKRRDGGEVSLVRNVRQAGWSEVDDGVLRFEITANAFCHQMIRSVVGTLVQAGLARKHAGEILGILAGRDRSAAAPLAPPHGLCLWHVQY
jgi:tRNA pseudouridine38-40 synthase